MKLSFEELAIPAHIESDSWNDWLWQAKNSLSKAHEFANYFDLNSSETKGFENTNFQIRATPYYCQLARSSDAIRQMLMPSVLEAEMGVQSQEDPLGEKRHSPAPRIVHRYPDRILFLVTDTCSVYCRYCTRKYFTGKKAAFVRSGDYDRALSYIYKTKGLREVILSGGDPLTLSDGHLETLLSDLRSIEHVEIIRIGTRMPVVCPMRITPKVVEIIRKNKPVFVMTHFNHPRELTRASAEALDNLVDNGIPVFNQMVLLNGINNHSAIVQALSRRLLYLRVKPYYMFQCDPSPGTDHLRTSVDNSLEIQRELWGRLSGLAMPNLSLDIPDGGGKVGLVPEFQLRQDGDIREFEGWDGHIASYVSPPKKNIKVPLDHVDYIDEWESLKNAKS